MVTYLLKKSYQRKTLKEIKFQDLWGDRGVFTTMMIFGKPARILFFKNHIENLIKSAKHYKLNKLKLKNDILNLIKRNINKKKNYNHLLRVALNNKTISISLRKRVTPKLKFNLKLIKYRRVDPEFKNLKYKIILKHLSKMDHSSSDVALSFNNKILESGTSNILLIKNNKVYSPLKGIYRGITYKFFKQKLKKIINKNILINTLDSYDEIILIGSGKGVASIQTIRNIKWKRRSLKFYKKLSYIYNKEISKCLVYK
jgi:branched-subunit amino acid aminotransferase/4-amino-4-deoxychorismate lyase